MIPPRGVGSSGREPKVMSIQDFVVIQGFGPVVANSPKTAPDHFSAMRDDEERELRSQLARLRQEHRDLDTAIEALHNVPGSDLLQVQRLKKRKLVLRDRIISIEDQITPDIIA
jgi:hypothetical protein